MAIEKITSVIASTDDWTMSTAGVAPTMKRGDDGKFYQQNNDAGEGRWTITLMVQRPGSTTLEQLDVKVWGVQEPSFTAGEMVRFVGDRAVVHSWGMQSGNRVRSGLWFEIDGVEAA